MRCARNPQRQLGRRRIRDIRVPADTGDDLPAVLPGFQLLRGDCGFRRAVTGILNRKILPNSQSRGASGDGPAFGPDSGDRQAGEAAGFRLAPESGERSQDASPFPRALGHPGGARTLARDAGAERQPSTPEILREISVPAASAVARSREFRTPTSSSEPAILSWRSATCTGRLPLAFRDVHMLMVGYEAIHMRVIAIAEGVLE